MSTVPLNGGLEPPSKRRKLSAENATSIIPPTINPSHAARTPNPRDRERPITPPPSRRTQSRTPKASVSQPRLNREKPPPRSPSQLYPAAKGHEQCQNASKYIASPIQLTRIRDLPSTQNVDTIGLGDILGEPLIRECWNFNFLFDLDFVMKQFDADVRELVKVKIVHGFWKTEDERRIALLESSEAYPNVQLISAFMPDPFGTHHTKMLILFRHDGYAQVVIHTANMISRDWGNMTQAVWRSPLLFPLRGEEKVSTNSEAEPAEPEANHRTHAIGTGERFKVDLLRYLEKYGKRLSDVTTQLREYDFSAVRAAFLGSAPSRQKVRFAKPAVQTSWGWLGLREILSTIPIHTAKRDTVSQDLQGKQQQRPTIVIQVSSIATLGQTPAWLHHFHSVLSQHTSLSSSAPGKASITSASTAFFAKRGGEASEDRNGTDDATPTFNTIFPTAHEIRTSLDGYASGASIHMRLQSAAQQKQLVYMLPSLCHWKHFAFSTDSSRNPSPEQSIRKAFRGPAAPHIKTYIRFSDETRSEIDWALVTSANLSKQAWGEMENKNGEVWIQSWEVGVVVWPGLFTSDGDDADVSRVEMVPVFGKDMPGREDVHDGTGGGEGEEEAQGEKVVGFRMPYDLPLERYQEGEVPWCASMAHEEADWKGQVWGD